MEPALYIYSEVEGKKGGSNLVLCLMNHFKEMGYFDRTDFGELSIFADNCEGQNKNKITIWYILWISDTGVFLIHVTIFIII